MGKTYRGEARQNHKTSKKGNFQKGGKGQSKIRITYHNLSELADLYKEESLS